MTRLPVVTIARLTRPVMGAVTRVKVRLSAAASTAAFAASTFAADWRSLAVRVSNSSFEIAWAAKRFTARICSALANAAWARA